MPEYSVHPGSLMTRDGVSLFYETIRPAKPTVQYAVLFHNPLAVDCEESFKPLYTQLAALGVPSCLWNPRGIRSGDRSSGGYFNVQEYPLDAKEIERQFRREFPRIVALGHSIGGMLAQKIELNSAERDVDAIVAIESPENPKDQSNRYRPLRNMINNKAGRFILNQKSLNGLLEYAKILGGKTDVDFLNMVGNLRIHDGYAMYYHLVLPVGEDDYQKSVQIADSTKNCGSLNKMLEEKDPKKMPPVLLIAGSRDVMVPKTVVQSVYDTAHRLGYNYSIKEMDIDHHLDKIGNDQAGEIARYCKGFFDRATAQPRKHSRKSKVIAATTLGAGAAAAIWAAAKIYKTIIHPETATA